MSNIKFVGLHRYLTCIYSRYLMIRQKKLFPVDMMFYTIVHKGTKYGIYNIEITTNNIRDKKI